MPKARWKMFLGVALVALALVGLEISFQRPATRLGDVDLVESSDGVLVRVHMGSITSNLEVPVSTLNFQPIKEVEIQRAGSSMQGVSAGLLFEVLGNSPSLLKSVEIVDGTTKQILAERIESSSLEYTCCGEDSKLRLDLPAPAVLSASVDPVLEFVVTPSGCEYDRPKISCRFEKATNGGPVVINGGAMLLTSFEGLDLRGAVITNVDLRGSSFANADLSGAIFKMVDLREVNFKGAKIDQTIFRQITSDVMLGRP